MRQRGPAREVGGRSRLPHSSASSFNAENDKAAAASTKQLRIGVPALALRHASQSNARLRIGSGLRLARAREQGDQCRIDGELSSVREGQAIAHDLDPSGVADRHINVHVSDANIARNTRSGLATDTGKGMLERQRPSRKNTRGWQVRGQSAKGRRSRRSSKTRNCALAMVTSSEVGRTVNTRPGCGPAWESSRARDAGERSVKCVSSARARRRLG